MLLYSASLAVRMGGEGEEIDIVAHLSFVIPSVHAELYTSAVASVNGATDLYGAREGPFHSANHQSCFQSEYTRSGFHAALCA